MRFIFVLFLAGFCLVLIYFSVYFWGRGRTLTRFNSELQAVGRPWMIEKGDSPNAFHPSFENKEHWIWFEVRRDPRGLLVTADGQSLEFQLNKADALAAVGVFLWVESNVEGIQTQLVKVVSPLWKRPVIIHSEFDNVNSATKELRPLWSYGATPSDMVRWMSFDSLGLVVAASLNADGFVLPLQTRHLQPLTESLQRELKRREKFLILGPIDSEVEWKSAEKWQADGYLFGARKFPNP